MEGFIIIRVRFFALEWRLEKERGEETWRGREEILEGDTIDVWTRCLLVAG